MSELGEFLRTKREEQDISIERLQEMTKIQKRYLAAIEEGRYDSLPGAFYTRAFVKSYAEALRLNPEDVFETYGSELPQPKQQTTDLPSRAEKSKPKVQKNRGRKPTVLPALLGILFLLVVAAGIYLVVQETDQGNPEGSEPDDDPAIEMDSNEEAGENESESEEGRDVPEQEKDEGKAEEEPDSGDSTEQNSSAGEEEEETEEAVQPEFVETTQGNRSVFDVSGAEEMIIELELTGDAWLAVEDEEGSSLEDVSGLQAGDTVEMDLSGEDYVKINIGSSPNVIVRVNGEEVEYPIDSVHQHLIFDKQPQ
ncbi:helix-turn-helix domain-containing protein [Salibacterium aidingense]|uniref:helix-turn-helix domain-containing protein n=1 Tax=Salibacterium aidingense TaxID=384933 RepID=UPI003BE674B6